MISVAEHADFIVGASDGTWLCSKVGKLLGIELTITDGVNEGVADAITLGTEDGMLEGVVEGAAQDGMTIIMSKYLALLS